MRPFSSRTLTWLLVTMALMAVSVALVTRLIDSRWLSVSVATIVLLLCYCLTGYQTAPLRKFRGAVQQFGAGNYSARVGLNRQDELGLLARTFDQMAERVESRVAAQRRLLLDVTHELRSPLTRLQLAVTLAHRCGPSPDTLMRIRRESNRLNVLVDELLAMNRMGFNGDAVMKKEVLCLERILHDLVETCKVEATSRKCLVEVKHSEPLALCGDEELLRRALENVIRNAILHAPECTSVEIEAHNSGGAVSISVVDHGAGVPEEAMPHIFEPFYRSEADCTTLARGAGLGLAIAHRAVKLHDGRIGACNLNPGFKVEINLPITNGLARGHREQCRG